MDAKAVTEYFKISYGQLKYLINQIDALKRDKAQGKARDYSYRDLVLISLALVLRSDGFRLDAIKQAINELSNNWKDSENPNNAGVLLRGGDGLFRWSETTDLTLTAGEHKTPIDLYKTIPKFYYNVKWIANEVFELVE